MIIVWYDTLLTKMQQEKTYTHKELINELRIIRPDMAENTYNWIVYRMVKEGLIVHSGYDAYLKESGSQKKKYQPIYSEKSTKIIEIIQKEFPYVRFIVFETTLMNEFLNHLIAHNTIFLQVEKESSVYIFRALQDLGYENVMYKPNIDEFNLYWASDCIVITDLVSESPLCANNLHFVTLEKLLVDIIADKLIISTYSNAEYPSIMEQAKIKYCLDKKRMIRYAGRRNRKTEIKCYLEDGDLINVDT